MRIATKVVIDIETGKVVSRETYEYLGPVVLCGGGPSAEQKAAAQSQANMTNQMANVFGKQEAFSEAQQNKVNPFFTNMMNNGLPYFSAMTDAQSGLNARAFAPAKAQLEKQLGTSMGLPNGFATQARTDLASNQARSYDQQLLAALQAQQQAKQQGAAGLLGQQQIANPLGYGSAALQGNQSIMQAPLASPGIGGLLGGIAGGLASAIPF